MAATDQTYRNQKVVNIVFGVSCLAMLLGTIAMMVQDYDREWKPIQRKFRDVEVGVNERLMLKDLPSQEIVDEQAKKVQAADDALKSARKAISAEESRLSAMRDKADNAYRMTKAQFDSKMSYFDLETNNVGEATSDARRAKLDLRAEDLRNLIEKDGGLGEQLTAAMKKVGDLREQRDRATDAKEINETRAAIQKETDAIREKITKGAGLRLQLAEAKWELDSVEKDYRKEVTDKLAEPQKNLSAEQDKMKEMTRVFDRFGKTTAQKRWGLGDSFRDLPIIDGFAPAEKIQQVKLNDLTIDYGGFRDVPRFDRCMTCHLGIDRATFSRSAVAALTAAPEDLNKKLETAHKIYKNRVDSGEDLGFDPNDIPTAPSVVKLTKGEITQYMAHPRLDLFVDSNSPHPMQTFGCTICHAGQGSSTEFILASHTPNDFHQTEEWKKNHDWESVHFWDFPMHSTRFQEASCVKCHHQMTDLIRYGVKEEAPKVLQGYNLMLENGCFGCHEIAGTKGGRTVGPDIRLEPAPALEWLSSSERERVLGENPGNLRKVGPSLRRIAEKTNEEWTRKWILSPRTFREDTKMPHFYGLSNVTPQVLIDSKSGQESFPDVELHSIAHYLFAESNRHLEGKDTYRLYLIKTLKDKQQQLQASSMTPVQFKELQDIARAFGNLALLSVPMKANEINDKLADQKRLQEKLLELQKQEPKAEAEITSSGKQLTKVTDELIELATAVPLTKTMIDGSGAPVDFAALPKADKDHLLNGRRLFTERGCLACHAHDATTKGDKENRFSPLESHANFGPNLTRIAAKLRVDGEKEANKRWLVQWILNPNVHHPRAKMPVTFLKPEDANDVAEWLLSEPVTDYDQKDPAKPSTEALVALARVYLGKVKEVTQEDVDTILPTNGAFDSEKAKERLKHLKIDADEQVLGEKIDDGLLKWYIGKKSISRLGCYGCHDLPGFETSKPIGTALNDWGKKDPERLAFEDADAFVKSHYNIVPLREPGKEKELLEIQAKIKPLKDKIAKLSEDEDRNKDALDAAKASLKSLEESAEHLRADHPGDSWETKVDEKGSKKLPYDKYFFESLEHHHRDGFLNQKLTEPRAYDYGRIRSWDDRLRMPRFKFARTRRHAGESDADFDIRTNVEEAEAREAVMTFVLGLVADPIPLKYVNHPAPDRLAEVKGRQVLDKFNCAGCHQVSPGRYEFNNSGEPNKPSEAVLLLTQSLKQAKTQLASDHYFADHNAWAGKASPVADRLVAFGVQPHADQITDKDQVDHKVLTIRLANALRFTDEDGVMRDLPASSGAYLPADQILDRNDPHGGIFPDLLIGRRTGPQVQKLFADEPLGYLAGRYEQRFSDKPDDARSALPPPLVREGERVQPRWLYQFLQDPQPVRPQTHMLLRMPRFNMSPDEAMALVNFFGATAKLNNPDANLTYPYLTIDQRDSGFWQKKSPAYAAGLDAKELDARYKALEPVWKATLQQQREDLEAKRDALKKAIDDEKNAEAKKVLEQGMKPLEDNLTKVSDQIAKNDLTALRTKWKQEDAYASDAYRLLLNKELCQKCHDIGKLQFQGAIGPNLELASERLRPEWTMYWIANPNRMLTYSTQMPQNFGSDKVQWQESFHGAPLDQVKAVRDALMDLPRLADMPVNRPPRSTPK